jgi:hypothetical protein
MEPQDHYSDDDYSDDSHPGDEYSCDHPRGETFESIHDDFFDSLEDLESATTPSLLGAARSNKYVNILNTYTQKTLGRIALGVETKLYLTNVPCSSMVEILRAVAERAMAETEGSAIKRLMISYDDSYAHSIEGVADGYSLTFNEDVAKQLAQVVSSRNAPSTLTFVGVPFFKFGGLEIVSEAIASSKLTSLKFVGCYFLPKNVHAVCQAVKCTSLVDFDFIGDEYEEEGETQPRVNQSENAENVNSVIDALMHHPTVRTVNMLYNDVDETTSDRVAELIRTTQIKDLSVEMFDDVSPVSDALMLNRSITDILLLKRRGGPSSMPDLEKIMKLNASLTEFDGVERAPHSSAERMLSANIYISEIGRQASLVVGRDGPSGVFDAVPNEVLSDIALRTTTRTALKLAWVCQRWRAVTFSNHHVAIRNGSVINSKGKEVFNEDHRLLFRAFFLENTSPILFESVEEREENSRNYGPEEPPSGDAYDEGSEDDEDDYDYYSLGD